MNRPKYDITVKCICGSELTLTQIARRSANRNVTCDVCSMDILNKYAYHCCNRMAIAKQCHPNGFDICIDCVQSSIENVMAAKHEGKHDKMKYDAQNIIDHIKFLEASIMSHFDNIAQRDATRLVQELGRFFYLKIQAEDYDASQLSPSPIIDKLWHHFLLYPKKYYQFCKKFAGGKIIDHSPDNRNDDGHWTRFRNTLSLYRSTFREQPSRSIWKTERRPFRPVARKSAPAC